MSSLTNSTTKISSTSTTTSKSSSSSASSILPTIVSIISEVTIEKTVFVAPETSILLITESTDPTATSLSTAVSTVFDLPTTSTTQESLPSDQTAQSTPFPVGPVVGAIVGVIFVTLLAIGLIALSSSKNKRHSNADTFDMANSSLQRSIVSINSTKQRYDTVPHLSPRSSLVSIPGVDVQKIS
ncbi:hypothetical protein EDD86DRAFT_202685 [Gorgonomyces haynaldii]|nr:hypothetical protein EDD86DRAFT_202685 [Gorgonomyces haynaldii]